MSQYFAKREKQKTGKKYDMFFVLPIEKNKQTTEAGCQSCTILILQAFPNVA